MSIYFAEVVVEGFLFIWYTGIVIAIVDERGKIYWRHPGYPLFLVEYIVKQPSHEKDIWN